MNRRDIFKLAAVSPWALCDGVSGDAVLRPITPLNPVSALNEYLRKMAKDMMKKLPGKVRNRNSISQLVHKGEIPEGEGFSFQWTPVSTESAHSSALIREFSAYQTSIKSETACVVDGIMMGARAFSRSLSNKENDLLDCVCETWELRDMKMFTELSDHKWTVGEKLDREFGRDVRELLTPWHLERIYNNQVRNGAGAEAEIIGDARPVFIILCSQEAIDGLMVRCKKSISILESPTFNGENSDWISERIYRKEGKVLSICGFAFILSDTMPRHDLVNLRWVERKFKSAEEPGLICPLYENAVTEDLLVWHSQVMTRLVLREQLELSGGNGEISWVNTLIFDESGEKYFRDESSGHFPAYMMAAYRPELTQFGWTLRQRRQLATL